MENKQIHIGKNLMLSTTTHYKRWNQAIFGITANMETESFASNSLYEDVAFKRRKIEINLWLFLIGFHATIYGKMKGVKE